MTSYLPVSAGVLTDARLYRGISVGSAWQDKKSGSCARFQDVQISRILKFPSLFHKYVIISEIRYVRLLSYFILSYFIYIISIRHSGIGGGYPGGIARCAMPPFGTRSKSLREQGTYPGGIARGAMPPFGTRSKSLREQGTYPGGIARGAMPPFGTRKNSRATHRLFFICSHICTPAVCDVGANEKQPLEGAVFARWCRWSDSNRHGFYSTGF